MATMPEAGKGAPQALRDELDALRLENETLGEQGQLAADSALRGQLQLLKDELSCLKLKSMDHENKVAEKTLELNK
ncbi:hypothetical protein AAL_05319 [Moelleriella libera RCEF 2490]|uniref:Uncharacterized protein n=1 Tax=Moelleriella libera RCEF 2490 TaxID=1081109 RepID=A0A162IHN1_9HYPO|nr:hypothetical protein AAL_05319 [Moelleriella libera RCEF 2490]